MLTTLIGMAKYSKFKKEDIFTQSGMNGNAIIENIKFQTYKLNDTDELKYLLEVLSYINFSPPKIVSENSLLYIDNHSQAIALKKAYADKYDALCEVANWLNETISKINLLKNKNDCYSFNMDDEHLPKLTLLHEKLIDLKCIAKDTKLKDFHQCFLNLELIVITPIIWKESLPMLLKLIIRFQEEGIIRNYSAKQLNLCFDYNHNDNKFGRQISKGLDKIKNKTDYSIDIEQDNKVVEVLELFNLNKKSPSVPHSSE